MKAAIFETGTNKSENESGQSMISFLLIISGLVPILWVVLRLFLEIANPESREWQKIKIEVEQSNIAILMHRSRIILPDNLRENYP